MKKRVLYAIAVMASLALSGTSCTTDKNSDNNESVSSRDIKFESYTYDYIGEFTGSDTLEAPGGKLVRFIGQGILPQDIGDTDVNALRETLLNMAGVRITDGNAKPVLPDSMQLTDLPASETEACGETVSTLTTTLVTPRAVVWENMNYAYACLAAHGNSSTKYVNFCLTDGKVISLGDLFKKDYKDTLLQLIRDKIKNDGYDLLVPVDQIGIPAQFGLTSKGIIFSYDPYQIAPYSEGTIQVELSAGELSDILSPHGLYILLGIKGTK